MATVLSGTSGALYYKPAGTSGTFKAADVTNASNSINVGAYLNFQVNDKVVLLLVAAQLACWSDRRH